MRKQISISFLAILLMLPVLAFAQEKAPAAPSKQTLSQQRETFKARRKQIKKLVRQYKKAPEAEKPSIKAQVEELVSQGVDESVSYTKRRLEQERARLDNWEKKIKTHEDNLPKLKEQYVEDLLTGNAKKKHRQAKKEWKKQLKEQRKKNLHK